MSTFLFLIRHVSSRGVVILAVLVLCGARADAAVLFVDGMLAANCPSNTYSVALRSCGGANGPGYSTFASAMSAMQAGDTMAIRGGTYRTSLVVTKSGTASAHLRFMAYAGEAVVIDLAGVAGTYSGIDSSGRHYIDYEGLTVYNAPFIGFRGSLGPTHITITDCEFGYSYHSGIAIEGGGNISITRSRIHHSHLTGGTGHEAVTFQNVHGFSITDSEVHDNGKEGIDAKYGSTGGVIARNHVYGNAAPGIYLDAANSIQVFGNFCSGAANQGCITLAVEAGNNPNRFQTTDVTLYNNVMYGGGAGILFWIEDAALPWARYERIRIEYNTLVDNDTHNWGGIFVINGSQNFGSGNTIRNNIIMGNGGWAIRDDPGVTAVFTIDRNLFQTGEQSRFGSNAVTTAANPFLNRAGGDYHLVSDAAARGIGQSIADIPTDLEGRPRPAGATDVGAYQYDPAVLPGTTPPVAEITVDLPGSSALYRVSDTVAFSGQATDPDTNMPLPPSALSWRVLLNYCAVSNSSDCHENLLQQFTGVAGGTIQAPDHEYPAFLRFELTATKPPIGSFPAVSSTVSRTLLPETTTVTLHTVPSGLSLTIYGSTTSTPVTRTMIVNAQATVSAPTAQTLGSSAYGFSSWSDGGTQTHLITAIPSPLTFTATYTANPLVSVWNSWDVILQSGTPQGRVTAAGTGLAATLDFYESTNNAGVVKGALLSGFTVGAHPDAFNSVEQYWGAGTGRVYPYAGKSTINRGSGAGETNAPLPLGVRDLQLHPPNNLHHIVATFRVPSDGTYTIANLGVRRVSSLGGAVGFHVFNAQQAEIALLTATNNRAWVTSPTTYTLPNLTAGAHLYFAVDRAGDYAYDATEIAWTVTANVAPPPPPPAVWNSWDVVTQSGMPQGVVTAAATGIGATLEFYESTNNAGVVKGALLSGFTVGAHPDAFNSVERYWGAGTGTVYPYAGKSTVNRGAGAGETNASLPLGVRDLQLHPPNNLHYIVAAFRVPSDGTYTISKLGVRRVSNLGGPAAVHVFNAQQVEIAMLTATANQAWVTSPATYTLSNLTAGASLYFAVDRAGGYAYDATEIAWTITRTGP